METGEVHWHIGGKLARHPSAEVSDLPLLVVSGGDDEIGELHMHAQLMGQLGRLQNWSEPPLARMAIEVLLEALDIDVHGAQVGSDLAQWLLLDESIGHVHGRDPPVLA